MVLHGYDTRYQLQVNLLENSGIQVNAIHYLAFPASDHTFSRWLTSEIVCDIQQSCCGSIMTQSLLLVSARWDMSWMWNSTTVSQSSDKKASRVSRKSSFHVDMEFKSRHFNRVFCLCGSFGYSDGIYCIKQPILRLTFIESSTVLKSSAMWGTPMQ